MENNSIDRLILQIHDVNGVKFGEYKLKSGMITPNIYRLESARVPPVPHEPGEFGHLLPEDQIQPACQGAYVGALSIITYAHDKAFNIPNAAVGTVTDITAVTRVAMTLWSTIMAVSLVTGVSV